VFGDAVGRAQVDRGVAGKRRVVVAFIAEEILVAGGNDVGAKLPLLPLYNVGGVCRQRTIIGKNSRDLPEFFPN
jgi:hypothetical protein